MLQYAKVELRVPQAQELQAALEQAAAAAQTRRNKP